MEVSRSKLVSNVIGNCPSCDGLVRVPMDAQLESLVRCPHCKGTFAISAVLEQIPELEIVENAKPEKPVPLVDRVLLNENESDRKKFVVPTQLIKGAKRHRGRRNRGVNVETLQPRPRPSYIVKSDENSVQDPNDENNSSFAVTIEPDKTMEVSGASRSHRSSSHSGSSGRPMQKVRVHSSQRHRRLKPIPRSATVEAFKIAFGGLLAFPIAYLILLWGIGQDPLSIAPALGRTMPFIVPKSMRPKTEAAPISSRNQKASEASTDETSLQIRPTLQESILQVPDVAPDKND